MFIFGLEISPLLGHSDHQHESSESEVAVKAEEPVVIPDNIIGRINSEFRTILPLLKRSCFNCHSTETEFPWYHSLPIAKQIINSDIEEARKHLIFKNAFPFKSHSTPIEDLLSIKEVIESDSMPPFLYSLAHDDAKLTEAEKKRIIDWVENAIKELK